MNKKIAQMMIVISFVLLLVPQVWWFFNPEYTSMQLFFEWWHVYLISVVLVFLNKDAFK